MDELALRVQALPAELFNEILELVFTVNDAAVTIDKSYKPPTQLQVSRTTRDSFACTYYSTTTFIAKGGYTVFAGFMASLPRAYSLCIRHIHIGGQDTPLFTWAVRPKKVEAVMKKARRQYQLTGRLDLQTRLSMKLIVRKPEGDVLEDVERRLGE